MPPTVTNITVGLQTNNTVKVGVAGTVEGSCTELGLTEGGIEITNAREYYERKADQYIGTLGVDKVSERPTIKFAIAEPTLDNMRLAWDYPSTSLVGNLLSFGGNPTVTELTLFINCKSPGGNTRKYELYKVVPIGAGTHSYKKNDKTLIEFEFLILQDTTQAADAQFGTITDSGVDTTPPTIVLDTPADGGTVVQGTTNTVKWQITETNLIDQNSIIYGETVMIVDTTVHATASLVAGTLTYDVATKIITFTPTAAWTTAHTYQAMITTGLRDQNGNHLAATKIEQFQAT